MRRFTILASLALVTGLTALAAGQASAASQPAPTVTPEVQSGFGGYSVHPNSSSGFIVDSQASWVVPKVNCPGGLNAPRVAVWDGLWGNIASMDAHQGWLPQVGTLSKCTVGLASYGFIWEMESQISGDGTGPVEEDVTDISPGDSISASVVFNGPYGTAAAVRNFAITVIDNTKHLAYQDLDLKTNVAVPLFNIVRQGGVEIEGEEPTICITPLIGSFCTISATGGLAEYPTPIKVTKMVTTPSNDAAGASGWAYLRWEYKYAGNLLENTPASPDVTYNAASDTIANFTETWLRQT